MKYNFEREQLLRMNIRPIYMSSARFTDNDNCHIYTFRFEDVHAIKHKIQMCDNLLSSKCVNYATTIMIVDVMKYNFGRENLLINNTCRLHGSVIMLDVVCVF